MLLPGGAEDHLPGHFGISYIPWLRNTMGKSLPSTLALTLSFFIFLNISYHTLEHSYIHSFFVCFFFHIVYCSGTFLYNDIYKTLVKSERA